MSEATERLDGTDTGNSPERPRRRPSRRLALLLALLLVAGGLAAWVATSGSRATLGRAVAAADTTPGATRTTGPSAMLSPTVPDRLTAVIDNDAVRLSWQPATGPRPVTQYLVFRDGVRTATVANATGYRDTGAQPGHSHFYQVQAVDADGNDSALSPKVMVTVPDHASAHANAAAPTAATGPPPMPASWPSADSTGASGRLTTVSGDITLGTNGQVYQNMRVKGTIAVTACNVTIRNVEVDTGEPYTGDSTPDLFAIWLQESATCPVTIDHVSTITDSAPNVYVTTSIRDARGGPMSITNSKLVGAQLGILGVSTGTVRGNFIQLGPNMRGDHNDAVQADGSSNMVIDHNTLLNPNDQTSALALYTEYGNNTNDVVSDNLMAGGGYTCYCGDGATDNRGNPARAVHVMFVNNVFWRLYFADGGSFGSGRAYNPAGGGQWTGNVYMNADGTLTTEQVPQPALDGQ